MKIVLNQTEIESAIQEFLQQSDSMITLRADQEVAITFDTDENDNSVQAILDITDADRSDDDSSDDSSKSPRTGAKKTRAKRTPKASSEAASDEVKSAVTSMSELGNAPWTEETKIETPGLEQVSEEAPKEPEETAPEPDKSSVKIFPDLGSSAAPSNKPPEEAVSAKSLFANLTKPTQ